MFKNKSEEFRPIFHFTSKKNWINDPNGLVYYKGTYHLFFQYDPESVFGSHKAWGHAIGTDMVNWEEKDVALNYDEFQMYSGSAAIDKKDVLGVKKGDEDVMVLAYTANLCGQCIAYSNDGGKTFHKHPRNPVLPNYGFEDRDPKIFFHEETQKWVMVFYGEHYAQKGRPAYVFFTSDNLIDWDYESEISGMYECPDMRQIGIKNSSEKKWVILCCNGDYIVGDFDGRVFTPSQEIKTTWRNYRDYATQTWSDTPDDRVTQIAWLISPHESFMPYNQQLTFPVNLELVEEKGEFILTKTPIKEIENIYKETIVIEDKIISYEEDPFSGIKGEAFDIEYEFEYDPFARIYFVTPSGMIEYSCGNNAIKCHHMWEELKAGEEGTVKIRVLIDKMSLEIFADDGKLYMPFAFLQNDGVSLRLFSTRPVKLISAKVNIIK